MIRSIVVEDIKNGDIPSKIFDKWIAVASPGVCVYGRWHNGRPDAVVLCPGRMLQVRHQEYSYGLLRVRVGQNSVEVFVDSNDDIG